MREWNNFHLWLPGGMYRQVKPNPRLEGDLDNVLGETGFDLELFKEIQKKKRVSVSIVLELEKQRKTKTLTPEQEKIAENLCALGEIYETQLNQMIGPVYRRMLEAGYSQKDLAT